MVALISAADHIANYVHRTHRIKDYDATLNEGLSLLTCGDRQRWSALADKLPILAKAALRATREVLKTNAI
ncbi:MAG: hypothetical protein U0744_14745 [Gemmataceae bacterium]